MSVEKKFPWKQIFVIAFLGVGVFIVVEIYKAWRAGVNDLKSLVLAPWTALKAGWSAASNAASTVAGNAAAAASLPSLTQAELAGANAQLAVSGDYQPGGTIYEQIAATQGQAAADAAAAAATKNAQTQLSQAQSDSSWFGFGNLWNYL